MRKNSAWLCSVGEINQLGAQLLYTIECSCVYLPQLKLDLCQFGVFCSRLQVARPFVLREEQGIGDTIIIPIFSNINVMPFYKVLNIGTMIVPSIPCFLHF